MSRNRKVITDLVSEYTKVPNRLFELAASIPKAERRIYCVAISVYSLFAGSAVRFNPSVRYLARRLTVSKDTVRKAIRLLVRLRLLIPGEHINGYRIYYTITHPCEWLTTEADHTPVKDGSVPQDRTEASYGEVHNNKETMNENKKAFFSNPGMRRKESDFDSEIDSPARISNHDGKQAERCPDIPLPTHIAFSLDQIINVIKTGN